MYDAALQEYIDWTVADNSSADFFSDLVDIGDIQYVAGSDKVMRAHAEIGETVYKYYMTHEPSR